VYTPAEQAQLFENYILQDKYLSEHRGQYAERNGGQMPWLNRVDIKFMQDIFMNIGKNRNTLQFTADIFNFGNLIDPNWGKLRIVNATQILAAPSTFSPTGTTLPTFQMALANNQLITKTFRDNVSSASTYSIQFGLRYIFN
jgi:hypothetical protein